MAFNAETIRAHLEQGDFTVAFNALGWDAPRDEPPQTVSVTGREGISIDVTLKPVGEKRGFIAYICDASNNDALDDGELRRRIDNALTKLVREHLIVFYDRDNAQFWTWARRETGKSPRFRFARFIQNVSEENILQKLRDIYFDVAEEDKITISDVTHRTAKAFDVDKVTNAFYTRFKAQRDAFAEFLEGIPDKALKRWYVSVVLNRLMFIYFLQKKGFLDGDNDYLRSKFEQIKTRGGGYYRTFLCPLFFEGFAMQPDARSPEASTLLGEIPYLNGGLFTKHGVEQKHDETIVIPDEAFDDMLAFFGEYEWHLDDRPLQNDKAINPDVLGHIFEKYINQKQMGAYYTKEDITDYIGNNTIIPWLFEQARKKTEIAFEPSSYLWKLLTENADDYIYEAMRHGTQCALPPDINAGCDDIKARAAWNTIASEAHGLPSETWRETIARRARYFKLKALIESGGISTIDDFITHNLDITQFAIDALRHSEGPDLVRAFWKALERITVLDPACGSGAFLFAGLKILYGVYDACLEIMEKLVGDRNRNISPDSPAPRTLSDFDTILEQVKAHPNRDYFIYKSIIIRNLYGVDLMEEATEICKLRMFLQLAAQLENPRGIEPLPDIDFNIKAGNSLIGYTSFDDVEADAARRGGLLGSDEVAAIKNRTEDAARALTEFRRQQTELGGSVTLDDKEALREKLTALEAQLNQYLAQDYGIDLRQTNTTQTQFDDWHTAHRPFHWLTEFNSIIEQGGFDVIIGNPPYVARNKVDYEVKDYQTSGCPDIYSWFMERSRNLNHPQGKTGMIVPLSLSFSSKFDTLRSLLFTEYGKNWFSTYGRIPSALFEHDVRVRHVIHIATRSSEVQENYATRFHRWNVNARAYLFPLLSYAQFNPSVWKEKIPKLNTQKLIDGFEKLLEADKNLLLSMSKQANQQSLHFKTSAYNWLATGYTPPPCFDSKENEIPQTKVKQLFFDSAENRKVAFLLLNGKWQFAFWIAIGDDFDVTKWMMQEFPADLKQLSQSTKNKLIPYADKLNEAMQGAIVYKQNAGKRVGNYDLRKCRHITDVTDAIFAEHFGLADLWEDIELLCSQVIKTRK